MNFVFSIFVAVLTQLAESVLASAYLLARLLGMGSLKADWEEIRDRGRAAEAADRAQKTALSTARRLTAELGARFASLKAGIGEVKRRRAAVLLDLSRDPAAGPDDLALVAGLSFAIPAPKGPPRKKPAKRVYPRRRESDARAARSTQLLRMLSEIKKRPRVLAAFAARGLTEAQLEALLGELTRFSAAMTERDEALQSASEAADWEQAAVKSQQRSWAAGRPFLKQLAATDADARAQLNRLADAREQAKTGKKRSTRQKTAKAAPAPAAEQQKTEAPKPETGAVAAPPEPAGTPAANGAAADAT